MIDARVEAEDPCVRDQSPGRLVADDAAAGGWDADTAALVAANGHVDGADADEAAGAGGGAAAAVVVGVGIVDGACAGGGRDALKTAVFAGWAEVQ